MAVRRFATFAVLAMGAYAQASAGGAQQPILNEAEAAEKLSDTTSPTAPGLSALKVTADVVFPDASVLGIKLVNGQKTTALFKVKNDEADPIKVRLIGGSLWSLGAADLKKTEAVRNLSSTQFTQTIAPHSDATLTYKFKTELHPQDLRLSVVGVLEDKNHNIFQLEGFSGTVSIVEAPFSIFDPQILFLYTFLTALFTGTVYFIFQTWIAPLLPQQKKTRRPATSARVPSAAAVPLPDDVSAAATGSKTYDESWIDPRHLNRPAAKRVGSGAPKSRAK